MPTRFLYVSYVSDDIEHASKVLTALGMPAIWRGVHPYFGVPAVLCATRRGGILVLGPPSHSGAHPAIERYARARERMFHFAVAGGANISHDWLAAQVPGDRVSDLYEGPVGPAVAVRLPVGDDGDIWMEVALGDVSVGAEESVFRRVESTPMVASSLAALRTAFASLGFVVVAGLDTADFPTLAANSQIILLEDWHFLELNEPSEDGIMRRFLSLIGAGLFGVSIEHDDLKSFAPAAASNGIATNTDQPMTLPVRLNGIDYVADDIVTVPPSATGGARIFVLTPLDYPWKLLP